MAHILPETPPQTFPREVLRVFHALKALPDTFYIWHHLAPWLPDAPDFLVLHKDERVLLVKVSSAAAGQASTAAQMLLLEDNRVPLGEIEAQVLQSFLASLCFPKEQKIETLVVFPNIPDKQVQVSRLERGAGDPAWVGKEILQRETDSGEWEAFFPSNAMDSYLAGKTPPALHARSGRLIRHDRAHAGPASHRSRSD